MRTSALFDAKNPDFSKFMVLLHRQGGIFSAILYRRLLWMAPYSFLCTTTIYNKFQRTFFQKNKLLLHYFIGLTSNSINKQKWNKTKKRIEYLYKMRENKKA